MSNAMWTMRPLEVADTMVALGIRRAWLRWDAVAGRVVVSHPYFEGLVEYLMNSDDYQVRGLIFMGEGMRREGMTLLYAAT
jgi:hypothetical protein